MRYLAIIIILAGVVGTALAQVDTSAVIQTAQQNIASGGSIRG